MEQWTSWPIRPQKSTWRKSNSRLKFGLCLSDLKNRGEKKIGHFFGIFWNVISCLSLPALSLPFATPPKNSLNVIEVEPDQDLHKKQIVDFQTNLLPYSLGTQIKNHSVPAFSVINKNKQKTTTVQPRGTNVVSLSNSIFFSMHNCFKPPKKYAQNCWKCTYSSHIKSSF